MSTGMLLKRGAVVRLSADQAFGALLQQPHTAVMRAALWEQMASWVQRELDVTLVERATIQPYGSSGAIIVRRLLRAVSEKLGSPWTGDDAPLSTWWTPGFGSPRQRLSVWPADARVVAWHAQIATHPMAVLQPKITASPWGVACMRPVGFAAAGADAPEVLWIPAVALADTAAPASTGTDAPALEAWLRCARGPAWEMTMPPEIDAAVGAWALRRVPVEALATLLHGLGETVAGRLTRDADERIATVRLERWLVTALAQSPSVPHSPGRHA